MISLVKKDYDSTKIYRKTQKKGASQTYDTPSRSFHIDLSIKFFTSQQPSSQFRRVSGSAFIPWITKIGVIIRRESKYLYRKGSNIIKVSQRDV